MRTGAGVERLSAALLADLSSHAVVSGSALTSAARVWNRAVAPRPALLVRCSSTADVQAVTRGAVANGLPLSVRNRGHDWAGRGVRDGAVVVDLRPMRRVEVNATTVHVEGGAAVSDVLDAAQAVGLTTPGGNVGEVGTTGLATTGGYGKLAGLHGLVAVRGDNRLAAQATGSPAVGPQASVRLLTTLAIVAFKTGRQRGYRGRLRSASATTWM